ncbi:hypothetical protein HPG69_015402 [Diceros bicornis minor]|uniref:Uncharacterized protein n=1 Tax=Diceros bicornis minor TaxID=77932 RepID=A0A7J7F1M3_DICBM|nr:hypothetical protein HPG69_015402 [Diceros bicornis minor]
MSPPQTLTILIMVMGSGPRIVCHAAGRLTLALSPSGTRCCPGPQLPTGPAGSPGQCGPWRLLCSEVMGNPGAFKRGLLLSALSYLVISQAAVVLAPAKVFRVEVLEQADYLRESRERRETERFYQVLTRYKERWGQRKMQSYCGGWPGHHGIQLSLGEPQRRRKGSWCMKPSSTEKSPRKRMMFCSS